MQKARGQPRSTLGPAGLLARLARAARRRGTKQAGLAPSTFRTRLRRTCNDISFGLRQPFKTHKALLHRQAPRSTADKPSAPPRPTVRVTDMKQNAERGCCKCSPSRKGYESTSEDSGAKWVGIQAAPPPTSRPKPRGIHSARARAPQHRRPQGLGSARGQQLTCRKLSFRLYSEC